MNYPTDQDVAALWNSIGSALALATYVVGGFMIVLLLLIAFGEMRARRIAAKNAAATAPEHD